MLEGLHLTRQFLISSSPYSHKEESYCAVICPAKKNMALVSSKWKPQVYNGTDSVKVYFGDEGELNCSVEVFSQYGGNLYSMILIFKDTETWVLAGQDIDTWEVTHIRFKYYRVSSSQNTKGHYVSAGTGFRSQ